MKNDKPITRFTIDLPSHLHKRLKVISALTGINMRDMIVDVVKQVIDKQDKNEATNGK